MNANTALAALFATIVTAGFAPTAEAACNTDLEDALYRNCAERQMTSMSRQLDEVMAAIDALYDRMDQMNDNVMEVQDTMNDQAPLWRYLEVDSNSDSIRFVGANVFVQSGSGYTDGTPSGVGNLIIGYNEGDQDQSGSHNLVLGAYNGFSSYGGLVAGYDNHIGGQYATVLGGENNAALADLSTIAGGDDQTTVDAY